MASKIKADFSESDIVAEKTEKLLFRLNSEIESLINKRRLDIQSAMRDEVLKAAVNIFKEYLDELIFLYHVSSDGTLCIKIFHDKIKKVGADHIMLVPVESVFAETGNRNQRVDKRMISMALRKAADEIDQEIEHGG